MKGWGRLVLVILFCSACWGCATFIRKDVVGVVKEYLNLEVGDDTIGQQRFRTMQSNMLVSFMATPASKLSGLDQWRLAKFDASADRVQLNGPKAAAVVAAFYSSVNPGQPGKRVALTIYLEQETEHNETMWKVDEVHTRYEMLEKVAGKGYGDLWLKGIRAKNPTAVR